MHLAHRPDKKGSACGDARKVMVVQTAPAVRVGISEALGLPPGTIKPGQLVTGLKKLGFDYVFGEAQRMRMLAVRWLSRALVCRRSHALACDHLQTCARMRGHGTQQVNANFACMGALR